ncbi:MAG: hypothetical protein ACP5PT_06680 [Brevinematia bacterium]
MNLKNIFNSERLKLQKAFTLSEVLTYTLIFSLFTILTIYTFLMINKTYRVLLAKNNELISLQKATMTLTLNIVSNPPRDGVTPAYTLIMSSPWRISSSASRRVKLIEVRGFNNNNPVYVEKFLYFEGTPLAAPFNDGRICLEVRQGSIILERRILIKNIEDCRFQVMQNGIIQSSTSTDVNGDSVLAVLYIQETKYNKKLVSSFIVSGQ